MKTPRRKTPASWLLPLAASVMTLVSGCAGRHIEHTPYAVVSVGVKTTRAPTSNMGLDQWHGVVPLVQRQKPTFVLSDTNGHPYDFAQMTHGKATLLFFGYTNCADICPTTLADISVAVHSVNPVVRRDVTVVFVTTDPARDDAHRIRQWLNYFDPDFVGLRGTATEIAQAETAVGLPSSPPPTSVTGNYDVIHPAQVTGYGSDELNHVMYFPGASPDDYQADLPRLAGV